MKVRNLIFLVMLVVFASFASAASFEVTKTPIKSVIDIDELAEYEITIHNYENKVREFRIRNLEWPNWDVYTLPLENPLIKNVGSNLSRTIKLYIDPMHVMDQGTKDVNIEVSVVGGVEKGIVPLRVTVSSVRPQGYVPTVLANIKIPEEINPSEPVLIKMDLDNQNILSYDNLLISFKGNAIDADFETTLNSSEKKYEEMILNLDPKLIPQKDTVVITIYSDGTAISKPMTSKVEILQYSDILTESESSWSGLGRTKYVKFTNKGNIENEEFPEIKTSVFNSLFTSTSPKAKRYTKAGTTHFYWEETIFPYESLDVRVSENYIILIILIVLTILVVITYYKTKSPLRVLKSYADVKKKEGGIYELNVMLTLKNDSNDKMSEIKISDKVPHIVKLEQDITIGTLKPVKILTHEIKGTLVVWKLEGLNPSEERVIKYSIKSMLPILGDLKLPSAKAKFHNKGKQWVTKSNGLIVSS